MAICGLKGLDNDSVGRRPRYGTATNRSSTLSRKGSAVVLSSNRHPPPRVGGANVQKLPGRDVSPLLLA